MSLLFLSYSSKDRDLVTTLINDLSSLGHDLWYDAELTGMGGQKWWLNILSNVRECDVFIFALTPNSLSSEPCKREYNYAYALCKPIIPVMLETVDVAVLPTALQEIQFVDYRERSAKQGIALVTTLNNLPPARPMPDPLPSEPETPLPPLAHLSQRLDAPMLNSTEQIEIVFNLETLFKDTSTQAGAETLLRKLYAREDLTNRVAERIRSLLPDRASPQTIVRQSSDLSEKNGKSEKEVIRPVAQTGLKTITVDPKERHHTRRLLAYFLIPIISSGAYLFLLLTTDYGSYGNYTPFLLGILLSIFEVISLVAIWRWKKWGVYLLILSLIATAMGYSSMFYHYPDDYYESITIISVIIVLLFCLTAFSIVIRDEWDNFEASPFRRIDKLFSGSRTHESAPLSELAGIVPKRGLWLSIFLLIPVLASVWLASLLAEIDEDMTSRLLIGALLFGVYGTWNWRMWGIWFLRAVSILCGLYNILVFNLLIERGAERTMILGLNITGYSQMQHYQIAGIAIVTIFIFISFFLLGDRSQFR